MDGEDLLGRKKAGGVLEGRGREKGGEGGVERGGERCRESV